MDREKYTYRFTESGYRRKRLDPFLAFCFTTFLSPPPPPIFHIAASFSLSSIFFFDSFLSPQENCLSLDPFFIAGHVTMGRGLFSCFGKASSSSKHASSNENATADLSAEEQRRGGAVVVELFSSQGCVTSPEAELLLSRLGRGDFNLDAPVILLAYHVDYWDYMGWKDPFGSSQWTVRQKAYVEALKLDTMFTPQVVVQGKAQCMGNDQDALLSCIADAPRVPAPTLQATFQRSTPESLQVSLTGALRTKVDSHGADVMVALYENGLVTDCPKGRTKGVFWPMTLSLEGSISSVLSKTSLRRKQFQELSISLYGKDSTAANVVLLSLCKMDFIIFSVRRTFNCQTIYNLLTACILWYFPADVSRS
ncbi:unnamed protein product [Ilex paraguariensis]|uniref:Uncharacterized protein n=1 Tax=Ilex paraguariensis TaxID=185542 RepID=A0ABC8UPU4_9AQUA